ncbi:MAG: glycosyltransferase family 2 protein [Candidatus Eisenbacteria bacterium]
MSTSTDSALHELQKRPPHEFQDRPPHAFLHDPSLDLTIVIVSYNVRDLIVECLESVRVTMHGLSFETIVVDNASTDGSAEAVRRRFTDVRVIESPSNLGFAAANNVAIRESRGRFVLLLNPDTRILENRLPDDVCFIEERAGVGALGCRLVNPDGTPQPSCYRFPCLREVFGFYFGGPGSTGRSAVEGERETRDVDFVRGAFMLLRRAALERTGALDERFFMYAEEADLCLRLKCSGWRTVYRPRTVVMHRRGKSAEQLPAEMFVQRMRSLVAYFRKHHARQVPALRTLLFVGSLARVAARLLPRGRRARIPLAAHLSVIGLALGVDPGPPALH